MATVTATRRSGFTHDVDLGPHAVVVDEPADNGGADHGPSPTRLLAGALASCTAITVEMYADRKGWELPGLQVDVEANGNLSKGDASYEVALRLPPGTTQEQERKLTVIASKCPVHKAIAGTHPVSVTSAVEG